MLDGEGNGLRRKTTRVAQNDNYQVQQQQPYIAHIICTFSISFFDEKTILVPLRDRSLDQSMRARGQTKAKTLAAMVVAPSRRVRQDILAISCFARSTSQSSNNFSAHEGRVHFLSAPSTLFPVLPCQVTLNIARYIFILRSTSLSPLLETPTSHITIFSIHRLKRKPV